MTYGTIIPNLEIDGNPAPYPVVNERSIRAAAGLMFAIGFATFMYVFLTRDFAPLPYVVGLFWLEFFLKTVFAPKYSIFGFVADLIVRKQKPEYVGAIQKRFAWAIGLALATIMLVFAVFFGVRGWLPFSLCSVCLFFMWLESACGICVGCKIYSYLVAKKILKQPEIAPVCPGGVCQIPKK